MKYEDLTLEQIEKALREIQAKYQPSKRVVKVYGLGQGALDLFNEALIKEAQRLGFTVPERFLKKNLENPK